MSDWTCTSCGRSSPAGTRFCGHCGTPAAAAPAPAQTWACRACGTANLPTMVFCGGCGAKSQPERAEEMRLVTALFADLSGFTTLADTLGVEDLHDVIRPLVAGLARIAERYEGFIEKYAGDALLVVFGAPVTHEDDAQRALLAALDMHATLPSLLADLGPNAAHLTIHIGVNTGRVISGRVGSEGSSDFAVLGDSVILAQRLESACPPGETYVGASTYALTSEEFAFESVGPLTLKGKLEPVPAYRLVGRREDDSGPTRPFVGRTAEVEAAQRGLAQAAVTTLLGDAGAGKSRLLAELERGDARRWLSARCLSYGATLPYWPLTDLLRRHLRLSSDTSPEAVAAAVRETLPHDAVPGARRLLGLDDGGEPERARREVHDALTAWLADLAQERPAVLVLEDVHWADRGTLEALAEVVRVVEGDLALLLTSRPEGRAQADEVAGRAAHAVVHLGPLDDSAAGPVAASALGGPAAPGLAALLAARAEGNALHLVELSRALADSGALVRTVDGWDLRPGYDLAAVPTGIERIFATRIDRLPPAASALLQLASVIGRSVPLRLLHALDDPAAVDRAVQVLLEVGMLEPAGTEGEGALAFSHALLQDVVYARLLRKRRRELHRRVADAARRLYGEADDTIGLLARHLFLADAGEEAVTPLLRAGRLAAGLFANDTAVLHLERAVTLLEALDGSSPRLDEARLELARVQERRGVYEEALRLYELRRQADGAPEAWRGLMAVQRARGDYDAALQTFVAAARALDPRRPAAGGVWVEAGWTLALVGRASDAVSAVRTALRLLGTQDRTLRAELLCQLVDAERLLGRLDDAVAHAREAVELADPETATAVRGMALRTLSAALMDGGRVEEAAPPLREALALAERVGALDEAAGCQLNLGLLAVNAGDAVTGVRHARAAVLAFEKLDHRSGRAIGYCNLAEALFAADAADEALHWCGRALEYATSVGHGLAGADALRTRARIELSAGSAAAAAASARASALAFAEHEALHEALVAWELVAEAARAAGDAATARDADEAARVLAAQR